MTSSLRMTLLAALAVLAVGGGAALAAGQYGGQPGKKQKKQAGKGQKPAGPQWRAFKQLSPTRLSQAAYLTGEAEVDDEGPDAGDPDAKGSANLLLVDESTVCYGFLLRGADTPTNVHIHRGAAGENGDVVVAFVDDNGNPDVPKDAAGAPSGDPGASSGCMTLQTPEDVDALKRIRRKPQNYYVNIHSETFPDGSVRGQLGRVWFDNDAD